MSSVLLCVFAMFEVCKVSCIYGVMSDRVWDTSQPVSLHILLASPSLSPRRPSASHTGPFLHISVALLLFPLFFHSFLLYASFWIFSISLHCRVHSPMCSLLSNLRLILHFIYCIFHSQNFHLSSVLYIPFFFFSF